MFAGLNASTADASSLDDAQQMLAGGQTADEVRKQTGWFECKDGNAVIINLAGKSVIAVNNNNLYGEPYTITQVTRKKGGIERNYFDKNGRQSKQIANNDHGNPKLHPFGIHGEHAHDYIYDDEGKLVSRPRRELTDEERKENGDIL